MSDRLSHFHVTIHARPTGSWPTCVVSVDHCESTTLSIPSSELRFPLGVSFEQACSKLAAEPRMFIEPDGSFVWVSSAGIDPAWQVDGTLYDRGGQLLYVELKGTCSREAFLRLLAACTSATSTSGCVVQLVRHALVMEIDEFMRAFL